MKIEDNFLKRKEFDVLQSLIMRNEFAWFYAPVIDSSEDFEDVGKFQFTHLFYMNYAAQSPFFAKLKPIFDKLKAVSMWRIKANLLTRTSNIIENTFHVDINDMSEENLNQWTTSIFYMNTNNGYTKFEDGSIVESVANRLVSFPSNMRHKGTSCTDEKIRVVINFNYFAKSSKMNKKNNRRKTNG